jgi:biotin/methionine sulfoxide reductase
MHSTHWGALEVERDQGRISGVRSFERDGDPSPLLASIPGSVHAPNRLLAPMVRAGWLEHGPVRASEGRGSDPYVEVSWDEAIELVASELARVRAEHGSTSIFGGSYGWSSAGRFHHAKTQLNRFLGVSGGYVSHLTNYSMAAAMIVLPRIVGSLEPAWGPGSSWDDLLGSTELVVMFGGLPIKGAQVESGGVGVHGTSDWLRRLRASGTSFVNVGPNRDDAPALVEAEWLSLRPNTDTALMLGLAHTLYAEGLYDSAFVERYCEGFDRFVPYLTGRVDGQSKDARWAGAIADVPAEEIRALARRMASSRTFLTAVLSIQRGEHGEQPYWMLVTLAAMLGQIGLPGGGFGFGYGNSAGRGSPVGKLPIPTLSPGSNPVPLAIPVARIADMLLEPGGKYEFNGARHVYPDIRLVYWAGGNPFHHHQDTNRLIEAWRRPETIIVHEPWWTATARHSDIVLPASTTFERNDIAASSRDRFVVAMQQAIEPVGEARSDFEILSAVAERLGVAAEYTEGRSELEWLRHMYETARAEALAQELELPDFDSFWERGYIEIPAPDGRHRLFEAFRDDPEASPLATPSGRIEIFSDTIAGFDYADCPGHPVWLEPKEWLGSPLAARFPLHLLSIQPATRLHSQLDAGSVSQASKVSGREPCYLGAEDAAARGIADGDLVRLFNDRGACLAGAVVTEGLRPGVVVLPVGAWYDPVEPGKVGTLDRHGNANVLTADRGTSRLAQGPTALSALVEVERFEGLAPPVSILSPPETVGRPERRWGTAS